MKHARLHITDTNPLNLCAMVELWLNDLEAGNASTNTITVYRFILNTFLREVGNIPVTDITPQHIRLYLIARRRQGKSPQTVAGNFRTIHTFFRWLCRQGILDANPCDLVESPKREKVIKRALTAEEVQLLLQACKDRPRDEALLLVLLDTGLRIHECHQLRVGDVCQGQTLIVRGKGGKYRFVPLSAPTRVALLRYLKRLGDKPADAPLWWRERGNKPMALEGLKRAVEYIGKRAGVKVGAHQLRRTFATWSLRNGIDLEHLRLLMGHSDLKTTQQYLALVEDDLKRAHEQFSPLRMLRPTSTSR